MKLTAFRVNHFKCLYETDWIPFFELTFFTGENDGGKSSTLEALSIFLDSRSAPSVDDFSFCDPQGSTDQRFDAIGMTGRFLVNAKEVKLLESIFGYAQEQIEIIRTFAREGGPSPFQIAVDVHPDPQFHKDLNTYTVAMLDVLVKQYGVDVPKGAKKADIVNAVREWLSVQKKEPAIVDLPAEVVGCLPEMDIFSSESALKPEEEIRKALTRQFRLLIEADKYRGRLSEISQDIKVDMDDEISQLTPFIQTYCEDIETVAIQPSFDFTKGLGTTKLQLHRRGGGPVLLERSGAGQKRRISLAVYEWQLKMLEQRAKDSRQFILAFDEPDTHLDYNSQRQIFDLIKRYSDLPAVQVIVTTHSLNMIERVPIEQIIHYRLDQQRHSQCDYFQHTGPEGERHELIDIFMYRISENMGLRNSIMLHERCFLAVEGITEMAALPVLFYLKYGIPLQSAGICIINGENNHGVRVLTSFLHKNRRQVLFLVDTDSKTNTGSRKNFSASGFQRDGIDENTQVFYIGENEFEDAFTDDQWIHMIQTHYPRTDGQIWQSAHFSALRSKPKFSEAIQSELYMQTGQSVSKDVLGYQLARAITDASQIPQRITDCFTQAYQFANWSRVNFASKATTQ